MHIHGSSLPNFRGTLKISDQNNWGGGLSKKLNFFWGGAKSKGEPEILGGLQGFPQILRTWRDCAPPPLLGGSSSKFDVEGLKSIHGGSMGGLKAVEKYL